MFQLHVPNWHSIFKGLVWHWPFLLIAGKLVKLPAIGILLHKLINSMPKMVKNNLIPPFLLF